MKVPYGRDLAGNIYSSRDRIGLTPEGTETTVESFYRYRVNRSAALAAHLMWQHEPNHVAQAPNEVTVLGTLRMFF